jgi:hypothetical protein
LSKEREIISTKNQKVAGLKWVMVSQLHVPSYIEYIFLNI